MGGDPNYILTNWDDPPSIIFLGIYDIYVELFVGVSFAKNIG